MDAFCDRLSAYLPGARVLGLEGPSRRLEFVLCDGKDYRPDPPELFDAAACLGASWIFGGHRGTLAALLAMPGRVDWSLWGSHTGTGSPTLSTWPARR